MPMLRDEWLAIGLSTEPSDRARAWRGARAAYAAAGLAEPRFQIWLRSPFEGVLGIAYLAQVSAQVLAQVRAQVSDQVLAQVRAQVRAQVSAQVLDWVFYFGYWYYDEWWLSWLEFFERACGFDIAPVDGLRQVARSTSTWWWPATADLVLFTERPMRLERDDRHRLHSASGAAIQYPDGWGIWSWHGVHVPRQVIEQPESLDPRGVLAEANAEVRRVMVERLGVDRFLAGVKAKVVDRDTDQLGHQRRLLRVDQPGDEPLLVIEVTNSTPEPDGSWKSYILRVPPTMKRCPQAVAWTFDMSEGEYQPALES